MWMKKLEENRYKKVYNSDARRVAWMVNNEGVELSEMPKSMSKKWTKAQYGRERYLATEFIKSKSEQLSETKFYAFFNKKKHTIDGNSLYDAKQKAILKLKVPKSKVGVLAIMSVKAYDNQQFRFESINEGKGVEKVLKMANDHSFGKLGGRTVDALSAGLFKGVYDKASQNAKDKINKMNEKQLYVFMTKLWSKFGNQVRIG